MKVQRISIGPGEVAGYLSKLKIGFDELGIKSEHFLLTSNKFNYQESSYFLRNFFLNTIHCNNTRAMFSLFTHCAMDRFSWENNKETKSEHPNKKNVECL